MAWYILIIITYQVYTMIKLFVVENKLKLFFFPK